jgi:anti-anti-sigma factor
MEYALGQTSDGPLATLTGRFVYADVGKIHDIIANWDFDAHPTVALDLRYVTFIDSTAIGALFVVANRAAEAGGDLKLCNPSPSVVKALTRADLPTRTRIVMDSPSAAKT